MSPGASEEPRPRKKTEYKIRFATRQAEKSWQDLLATQRNAIVDAWDFLTRTPTAESPTNHRMKADLATVVHEVRAYERWQYELTGGARIWFYVDDQVVHLVYVHTHHPNQTKR